MSISVILGAAGVILLIIILALQMSGRRNADLSRIERLFKLNAEEQRETVQKQIAQGATEQFERFGYIQTSVQDTLTSNRAESGRQMSDLREQMQTALSEIQRAAAGSNEQIGKMVAQSLQTFRDEQSRQLRAFDNQTQAALASFQQSNEERSDALSRTLALGLQESRKEQNDQISAFGDQISERLNAVRNSSEQSIEKINRTLENKIKELQQSNEKRLEQIQGVVDEKLHKTLEARLSQSFELVSKQLESVGHGLGEMKALAADARSLKNALTNVKERGTYGEVRLERLLADILAPNQYETNAEIENGKRVEFAVKLPGNGDAAMLLPIDSKFPIEDYNRLLDAEEKSAIDAARRSLTAKIRSFAKDIHDKYIIPPKTTDFALMFLPTEGLFAEVVQNAGLFEELRDKYKVTAVGATTLSAFLSSLQIGFKTLAIEKRSQEVWDILRAVKAEFNKFGDTLAKAQKQLQTVDRTLTDIVGTRTRAINRTLRNVEDLQEDEPGALNFPTNTED